MFAGRLTWQRAPDGVGEFLLNPSIVLPAGAQAVSWRSGKAIGTPMGLLLRDAWEPLSPVEPPWRIAPEFYGRQVRVLGECRGLLFLQRYKDQVTAVDVVGVDAGNRVRLTLALRDCIGADDRGFVCVEGGPPFRDPARGAAILEYDPAGRELRRTAVGEALLVTAITPDRIEFWAGDSPLIQRGRMPMANKSELDRATGEVRTIETARDGRSPFKSLPPRPAGLRDEEFALLGTAGRMVVLARWPSVVCLADDGTARSTDLSGVLPTNEPRFVASAASDGWLHLLLDERLLAVNLGSDVSFSLAVPGFSAGSCLLRASASHVLFGQYGYRYQSLTRTLGNGHEFAAGKLNGAQSHIRHAVLAGQRAHFLAGQWAFYTLDLQTGRTQASASFAAAWAEVMPLVGRFVNWSDQAFCLPDGRLAFRAYSSETARDDVTLIHHPAADRWTRGRSIADVHRIVPIANKLGLVGWTTDRIRQWTDDGWTDVGQPPVPLRTDWTSPAYGLGRFIATPVCATDRFLYASTPLGLYRVEVDVLLRAK
jgi:hypothetical protein